MNWPVRLALRLAVTSLAALPAVARAAPRQATPSLNVKSWELPNGLQVLFLEDQKAPVAAVHMFYHVGSKDEKVGIRGVAHMFEHLMSRGSDRVPPGDHARLLREAGGLSNAFTTEDVTGFQDVVPPAYVGLALELEAERMRKLHLSPAAVKAERQVVMEERRARVDSNPVTRALAAFRAAAFEGHPYEWVSIGTLDDLQHLTIGDCQRFYDSYYLPNNATVVVVGALGEDDVRRDIARFFGPLARGVVPAQVPPTRKAQLRARDTVVTASVQVPVVVAGYHIPAGGHPDIVPLKVLASVLAQGPSSRLNQRLVLRDHLALGAGGAVGAFEHPGMLVLYAVHPPDRDSRKVREALLGEVARVRTEGLTLKELERAKNQLASQFIYSLESADGLAVQLGSARYTEGDWHRLSETADRLLAVTADDIKRVADTYLVDDHLTVVTLQRPIPAAASGGNER